jgi:hypothetical protein
MISDCSLPRQVVSFSMMMSMMEMMKPAQVWVVRLVF